MTESQNIEYKELWKDDYLKWICGFANAQGGKIFIGINDNGKIVGIDNATKLMENIPNKVRDILGIIVDVNLRKEDNKSFIELKIEAYPYPVNYKGKYFYRTGSTLHELKGAALDRFMLKKKGKRWDAIPVPYVQISDLKEETLELFKRKAKRSRRIDENSDFSDNELLIENLQLKENNYLKNSAVLLFHPNPEKFVTGAYIKIGYFETDADLIFQDEVHGNLFEQIEKTMDLLFTKYIKAIISYEGIQRIETYEYPYEAVREALLNAVSHKDYAGFVPIQISVYNDKMMIWNYGRLPENWTIDKLKTKHPSNPYNPDIANAFFRSGYIES
jgi:ATP-dependent DNA helicase RecG